MFFLSCDGCSSIYFNTATISSRMFADSDFLVKDIFTRLKFILCFLFSANIITEEN